jgi:hypothetical protein
LVFKEWLRKSCVIAQLNSTSLEVGFPDSIIQIADSRKSWHMVKKSSFGRETEGEIGDQIAQTG